jgi:glycosyltransferase involved in cell wall biosynthesis
MTLVVIDADVLGRRRTGDETYVRNLLAELPPLAERAGIELAAVTRRPELVPEGMRAVELKTPVQELRMGLSLPRTLRRLGAGLVHTQYAVPLRSPCPCVVTVHDLSFVLRPELMRWKDRQVFRLVVPYSVRRAARVLTVSERTRRDLVETYGVLAERVVVTPNGVDPVFRPLAPGEQEPGYNLLRGPYALTVGSIERRKNQLAALQAASARGLRLVVAGPEKDRELADELRRRGAELLGYVEPERLAGLYREAACLVQTSVFEGFGLPVLEAMASGTPVVAAREPGVEEVAGGAVLLVAEGEIADGIGRALEARESLAAAGLERARRFSWRATAERTLDVYREALG